MDNKFTMELVWHNCLTHPPAEFYNDKLYVSDGKYVFQVEYSREHGWYDYEGGMYISPAILQHFWWTDLVQTVGLSKEFKEANYE
jgi:hypothetical protein